jgi:hypothetical protein
MERTKTMGSHFYVTKCVSYHVRAVSFPLYNGNIGKYITLLKVAQNYQNLTEIANDLLFVLLLSTTDAIKYERQRAFFTTTKIFKSCLFEFLECSLQKANDILQLKVIFARKTYIL